MYGWPKILKRKISDTEKALQLERLRLIRDLRSNQKIIEQTITRLADQVAEISVHKDLEMAITVCFTFRAILIIIRLEIALKHYIRN